MLLDTYVTPAGMRTQACIRRLEARANDEFVSGVDYRHDLLMCATLFSTGSKARARLPPGHARGMRVFRRLRGKTSHSATVAEPHCCPHCEKVYKSKLSLAVHVLQIHSGEYEPPVCQCCGVARSSLGNLRMHILRKHTERPPRVKCPFPGCKKTFKTGQDLQQHEKLVHMPRPHRKYECIQCDYVAKTRGVLKTHISNRHPPPEGFTCESCGQIFRNQASLQRHIRTAHRPQEEHQCSECGATYKSKSALRKHEVYHTKKWKWHRCSEPGCKKKFRSPRELRIHVTGHHSKPEDRIECPHCGGVLKNLYSLADHIAHRHPRPEGYKCSLCDHVARSRPRLREHVLDAHNEREHLSSSRGRSRSRSMT